VPSLEDRCTLRSDARGELLPGTASTVRRWLLVESAGPWGRDGFHDARLPDGVADALHAAGHATRARLLLIRRVDRRAAVDGAVTCLAVDARGPSPWIGRRVLPSIAAAAEVDLDDRSSFEAVAGPVAIVCTHGRRDVCCAERGRPLAHATAAAYPDATWESTHVGGDRFAANMVLFPHALYFGRVEAVRGPDVVEAYANGRIVLDRFRGRSTVPMFAQAAEIHVRSMRNLDGIDDVTVDAARLVGDVGFVGLRTPDGIAEVRVIRETGVPMRLTCQSSADEAPVSWRVDAASA
jgi:hypothetical protein